MAADVEYVETKHPPVTEATFAQDVLELAGYHFGIPTENVSIKWLQPLATAPLEPRHYDLMRRRRVDLDAGEVGHVKLAEPGTVWLVVGLKSRDLAATVSHELVHVGQIMGGRTDPSTNDEDEREAQQMERAFMDWVVA